MTDSTTSMSSLQRWRFGTIANTTRWIIVLSAVGVVVPTVIGTVQQSIDILAIAPVPALIWVIATWNYSRTYVAFAEDGPIVVASGSSYPTSSMLGQGNYWSPRALAKFVDERNEREIDWTWYGGIAASG